MTAQKGAASLETELRTFRSHRDELVGQAKGKYVLIKGERVVGFFEDQTDAISNGFKEFGNTSFLVKLITEVDVPLNLTSLNIGA
jgi:hypothetical protein